MRSRTRDSRSRVEVTVKHPQMYVWPLEVRGVALADAATRLAASVPLWDLLNLLLAVGNVLNGGTPRGGADGFGLDSLRALSTWKTVPKPKPSPANVPRLRPQGAPREGLSSRRPVSRGGGETTQATSSRLTMRRPSSAGSRATQGCFNCTSTGVFGDRMCQKKDPPFENLRRDDHSSKNEPKRVETDRDMSLES